MNRILVGFAGLAMVAGTASAAFLGLDIREDKDTSFPGLPAGARVFNFYAKFDGAGTAAGAGGFTNTVLSVGQPNSTAGFGLKTTGQFFQDGPPFGSNTAPNSGFFGFDPALRYDSFVSIGRKTSDGTSPGTGVYSTSVDNDFNFGANFIRGGWFNSSPPNLQGAAVQGSDGMFRTFLAQLTVVGLDPSKELGGATGPNTFESNIWAGELTIYRQGDVSIGEPPAVANRVIFSNIPTPGALSLFGVAGLMASRRRR